MAQNIVGRDTPSCPRCRSQETCKHGYCSKTGARIWFCRSCKRYWVEGRHAARREKNPPCPRCGVIHSKKNGISSGKQIYRCVACRRSWSAGGRTLRGMPRQRFCAVCGQLFRLRRSAQIYCSRECSAHIVPKKRVAWARSQRGHRRLSFMAQARIERQDSTLFESFRGLQNAWALHFAQCQGCGTTERPHEGRGYCLTCYSRIRRQARKDRQLQDTLSLMRFFTGNVGVDSLSPEECC